MNLNGSWCIATECVERFIDPGLKTEAVVEENVCILKSNEIRCRWFVVVDGDVVEAHVFQVDMFSSDSLDELADVVG